MKTPHFVGFGMQTVLCNFALEPENSIWFVLLKNKDPAFEHIWVLSPESKGKNISFKPANKIWKFFVSKMLRTIFKKQPNKIFTHMCFTRFVHKLFAKVACFETFFRFPFFLFLAWYKHQIQIRESQQLELSVSSCYSAQTCEKDSCWLTKQCLPCFS